MHLPVDGGDIDAVGYTHQSTGTVGRGTASLHRIIKLLPPISLKYGTGSCREWAHSGGFTAVLSCQFPLLPSDVVIDDKAPDKSSTLTRYRTRNQHHEQREKKAA